MSNIFNFANRQLCEYQNIFPSVAALLDHLLFTTGNGYDFDPESGMIVDGRGLQIDQYPPMSDADWVALIAQCHEKELGFAKKFAKQREQDIDQVELAEDCAKYVRIATDESMFSEDALYQQLRDKVQIKIIEAGDFRSPSFVRPYPLSPGFATVFELSENTPRWFIQIAINFCNAWVRFLTEEIDSGNVWIKPSLRPKVEPTEEQKRIAEGMAALFGMIKDDKSYDGWLDRKEPESDYADMTWTTKHRDLLAAQVQRLTKIR